ncbi:MAG: DUF123 domain-containing protein [Candidatus Pacebacteria bacterium]|nr:DUF123 domain-containing protein [Candidatus Paceibacterota bacterium]
MGAELTAGIYCLLIRLTRQQKLTYGNRRRTFKAGYYAYVGSAMGGLHGRLTRHLQKDRPGHWHIDHLLNAGVVVDAQLRFSRNKQEECALAQEVANWADAELIQGFGCSDCTCSSHLAFFAKRPRQSLLADDVLAALTQMYDYMQQTYEDHTQRTRSPFHTLVACILSLRTQDPVTDAAAARLFAKFPNPEDYQPNREEQIASLIFPVGMYRRKAANLVRIAGIIQNRYAGVVPKTIAQLTSLPGVGRKTANLVRSFAFRLPAVCVDTHVHRITNRWGLVRTKTPEETEEELRRILPQRFWIVTNPYLVQHGQTICRPMTPKCSQCPLRAGCRYDHLMAENQILKSLPGPPKHPSLNRFART